VKLYTLIKKVKKKEYKIKKWCKVCKQKFQKTGPAEELCGNCKVESRKKQLKNIRKTRRKNAKNKMSTM
jgi:hypothetical protein